MVEGATAKPRILLVDDEPLVLRSLARCHWRLPVEVLTAGTAEQAMGVFEEGPIELIISDLCLPGMSGLELLKLVRERWPSTACALLTGHGQELVQLGEPSLDWVEVLGKPCHPHELQALIRDALGLAPSE
jgi:DNA-binding NtrC family response regulator